MVLVATRRDAGKAQALGLTNSQRWGLPMPVAKIHLLEGQYSEARLDKVSNAIQEALVGCRHGGCDHAPAVGGRPQHPLRDVRRLSGLPHKKPQYMKRRSEFPTPQGREFRA
jgi:hypothetical protein